MRAFDVFENISFRYDIANDLMSLGIHRLWRKALLRMIKPRQTDVVLDLACGSAWLSECFQDNLLCSMDFSMQMLSCGSTIIKNPIQADALEMPFKDESFDIIVCAYGMRNFSNRYVAIEEIMRCLKVNGRFLMLDLFKTDCKLISLYNNNIIPLLGYIASGNKAAYKYLAESIEKFCTIEECCIELEAFGMSAVGNKKLFPGFAGIAWGAKTA